MEEPVEKWNIGCPLAKEKLHYITSPNPTLNVFFARSVRYKTRFWIQGLLDLRSYHEAGRPKGGVQNLEGLILGPKCSTSVKYNLFFTDKK
jgi:hypothetical protein